MVLSWETPGAREWSGDELWSKVIHKIVELAVALNLDSCYIVIRNRVKEALRF